MSEPVYARLQYTNGEVSEVFELVAVGEKYSAAFPEFTWGRTAERIELGIMYNAEFLPVFWLRFETAPVWGDAVSITPSGWLELC